MKVYITCPVSRTNKRFSLLPEIEKVVKSKNLETFVFKIGRIPEEIFRRDYEQLKSCDLIIAEVSEESHGVGIEIGLSFCLGLKRILLIQKGNSVTKFAQGMKDTFIIEYENIDDLKKKLSVALDKFIKEV